MAPSQILRNIYKIYAESFPGDDHLQRVLENAQAIVDQARAETRL